MSIKEKEITCETSTQEKGDLYQRKKEIKGKDRKRVGETVQKKPNK